MKRLFETFATFFIFCLFSIECAHNDVWIENFRIGLTSIQHDTLQFFDETIDPLFSWQILVLDPMKTIDVVQSDFQIILAKDSKFQQILWNSGQINASQSFAIEYNGPDFQPEFKYFVNLKLNVHYFQNDYSSSFVSKELTKTMELETAQYKSKNWNSLSYLSRDNSSKNANDCELYQSNPTPLFRNEFKLSQSKSNIEYVRLYISGVGYFVAFMNGKQISMTNNHKQTRETFLDPGWTSFNQSMIYFAIEIPLSFILDSSNCFGVMLGNGFWNPLPLRFWGHLNLRDFLTIGEPMFKAKLVFHFKDQSTQIIDTIDPNEWRVGNGTIIQNNVYLGEIVDTTNEKSIQGWNEIGFQNSWPIPIQQIPQEPFPISRLSPLPPVHIMEKRKPISINKITDGIVIVDFGINWSGLLELEIPNSCFSSQSTTPTTISIRYGELLYSNGSLNPMTSVAGQIKNGNGGPCAPFIAWQIDQFVCGGGERTNQTKVIFRPNFTWHAFRYVEISNYPNDNVTFDSVRSLRLHADVAQAKTYFKSSNEQINSIHQIVSNSYLSNMVGGVQSDCPHRERFGYSGDAHASGEGAILNFEMLSFYMKRLIDFEDSQRSNGGITETAPFVGIADSGLGGGSGPIEWESMFLKLQSLLHEYYFQHFGSTYLIRKFYNRSFQFVSFLANIAKQNNFLINSGLGDWSSLAEMNVPYTSTIFLLENFDSFSKFANLIGDSANSTYFKSLAISTKQSIRSTFFNSKNGCFSNCSQADQAFALQYHLYSNENEKKLILNSMLNSVVNESQTHFTTGIWGTKFLVNNLCELGFCDIAMELLTQPTYPSFGYMIDQGATSVWEVWFYSDNTYSHNHAMFGGVDEFMWKYMAGIRLDLEGGLKIMPYIMKNLTWVDISKETIFGMLRSSWKISKNSDGVCFFDWKGEIPTNMQNVVEISLPLDLENKERKKFQVGSGRFEFSVQLSSNSKC